MSAGILLQQIRPRSNPVLCKPYIDSVTNKGNKEESLSMTGPQVLTDDNKIEKCSMFPCSTQAATTKDILGQGDSTHMNMASVKKKILKFIELCKVQNYSFIISP